MAAVTQIYTEHRYSAATPYKVLPGAYQPVVGHLLG